MVKITTGEKIGNLFLFVENYYVNQTHLFHTPAGCGKPLWKKLWRMWKSVSFQQLFRFLKIPSGYVEK